MNRRSFLSTLPALAVLTAVPALGVARTHAGGEGVVTAGALNVRTGPGVRHPAIGAVQRGDRVRIHNYADGWYEISTRHISGWASSSYIDTVDSYSRGRDYDDHRDYDRRRHDDWRERDYDDHYTKPSERGRFAVIGRNRRGYVNMHDGPGREYGIVGRLSEGERVFIIEQGDYWTLVSKRGFGRGFVRSRFLNYL